MVRKLYVAVHGVGDQRQFDTIQQAAPQVIRWLSGEQGPRISLGTFSTPGNVEPEPTTISAVSWRKPFPTSDDQIGFAEVYWADLTRKVDVAGYRLEEAVSWAQTLVDRVAEFHRTTKVDHNRKAQISQVDFELIRDVIGELGDGVKLLGQINTFAPKLNLPSFDLARIVNQYLGDVQFVAEFGDVRAAIIHRFEETMKHVTRAVENDEIDEIYLITHSEGTVVTLIGLLRAFSAVGDDIPAWRDRLRGWMTIGSPIDKHLVIWPELWTEFNDIPKHEPPQKVVWWNYSDWGDPIGFSLDSARDWMTKTGWNKVFEFEADGEPHDFVFSRYRWPGQAHLDYWTDNDLFDHFLNEMRLKGTGKSLGNKVFEQIVNYVIPYALSLAVLAVAMFFLDSGVWSGIGFSSSDHLGTFTKEVTAFSSLLAGTTVLARMPRLVRKRRDKWLYAGLAAVIFALFAAVFWFVLPQQTAEFMVRQLVPERLILPHHLQTALKNHAPGAMEYQTAYWNWIFDIFKCSSIGLGLLVGLNAVLLRWRVWQGFMCAFCCFLLLAVGTITVATLMGKPILHIPNEFLGLQKGAIKAWSPLIGLWLTSVSLLIVLLWLLFEVWHNRSAGLLPLIGPGVTIVVGIGCAIAVSAALSEKPSTAGTVTIKAAVTEAKTSHADASKSDANNTSAAPEMEREKATIWPLVVGSIAFLFFWKLSVILFDLTFVWHRYIRNNVLHQWFIDNIPRPDEDCRKHAITQPTNARLRY